MSTNKWNFIITDIRVNKYERENTPVRGFADIVINGCFVVRGLRIIEGRERRYVAMPSKSRQIGTQLKWSDIAHPIKPEIRVYIEETVLQAYDKVVGE